MKIMRFIPFSLLAVTVPGLILAQPITSEAKERVLEAVSERIRTTAYVQGANFAQWDELRSKYKESFDKSDTIETFTRAVNIAFNEFKFSHLQLLSPRAATTQFTGKSVGIGVMAQGTEEGIRISRVIKDGPAEQAGVKVGDLIIKADGKPVSQPEQIRGEEHSKVVLTIKREDKTLDLEITRRVFSVVEKDSISWPDPKTALIRINSFGAGYDRQAVDKLFTDAAKAEHLIIDLRGNGGGSVVNLFHLAGKVLPNRTGLGKFVTKDDAQRFLKKYPERSPEPIEVAKEFGVPITALNQGNQSFAGKLAVLVNPGSGSASEIFAAAVQDHKRGKVVGIRTAGAVLASRFFPMPEGFSLQVPFMEYVTPAGKRLEGDGVKPDVAAEPKVMGSDAELIKLAQAAFAEAKTGGG